MTYPAYNISPHPVFVGLLSAAPAGSLPDGGYALSGLQQLSVPGFVGLLSAAPAGSLPDGGYALSGLQQLSAPGFVGLLSAAPAGNASGKSFRLTHPHTLLIQVLHDQADNSLLWQKRSFQ